VSLTALFTLALKFTNILRIESEEEDYGFDYKVLDNPVNDEEV